MVIAVFLSLAFTSCSKDSTYEPPSPQNGTVVFQNSLQYQAIIITHIEQARGVTIESISTEYRISPRSRKSIENLIDGGYTFPGGDDVSITFESVARHPAEPDTPYFERTVILTVNGTQNINVKGQEGEYDINGAQ